MSGYPGRVTQLPDSDQTGGGRHPSIVERIETSTTPRVPFSVEFYPPRDEAAEERLWRAASVFSDLGAAFAGGAGRAPQAARPSVPQVAAVGSAAPASSNCSCSPHRGMAV